MASKELYAAAHFALELDHSKEVGLLRTIDGGGAKAEVMTYQYGANKQAGYGKFRQLGKVKFDDVKLSVGMSMSQPFYNWLQDFFGGKQTRKDGALIAADFYYQERARRTFTNALIKELTFPKLDATDKNPAYMNVTMTVEDMAYKDGSGEALTVSQNVKTPKLWTAANFELSIDGIDVCSRATKIDSFTIKQTILEYHAGGFKGVTKSPSQIEFPNIVFYLPETDSGPLVEHMQKRVGFGGGGKGQVRDGAGLHGQITCFDNDQHKGTLFTLEFYGADIVSVVPDKSDANNEQAKMVKVELYTERMSFWYPNMELE